MAVHGAHGPGGDCAKKVLGANKKSHRTGRFACVTEIGLGRSSPCIKASYYPPATASGNQNKGKEKEERDHVGEGRQRMYVPNRWG